MNAGFNTMPITHRIDEFVFDCSYDSLAQANTLEPEMSALLTDKLLPVIDSILDEFDEADTVWRLGQVEIDLGDIFSDDFHTELMLRVQEKLREKLLRLQDHHHSLDSVLVKQLPVQRLNKLQTDLEQLQDFLLTGRMPWPIDTADRHAHENMLRQIVQQQDARKAWVMLLKHLTAAQRTIAIGRLVSQFSHRSLENVLTGIAPADARPLLDFLSIYQHALSAGNSKPAVQAERIRSAWEQLFRMLLESNPLPGNWTILLDRLIKTIVLQHAQESSSMLESVRQTAAQYHEEEKISGAFHAALQTVNSLYLRHPQHGATEQPASLKHRSGSHDAVQSGAKETKSSEEKKREMAPETTASPDWRKQTKAAYEDLYVRIGQALQKAGLIDAGFTSLFVGLPSIERRQRLRGLLQLPAVKSHLPQLPRAVLLDISYLLSPQAALLIECLLVHAGRLYRLSGSSGKTTQKRWQQQLWVASLDYLLTKTHVEIDPAVYLQALAHGVSIEEADPQITLRIWYEALEHSESGGVLATLLRICIDSEPEWRRTAVEESAYPVQEPPEVNVAYRKLQQRLTTGKSSAGQDGLLMLLKTLATDHPEQLQQLYRDLRNGRYDLIAAQLNAIELHGLIEKLLQVQASTVGADWQAFLQAIETQVARVDDQTIYYRRILEDLLQEREIDLEAIAALARRSRNRIQEDKEEWNEQTEAEEAERIEETEAVRTAEQARSEAAADPVTYPTEQSTRQIRTDYAVLYSRITAALREAGLIDQHPEVISSEVKSDEHRQRLRAILRGINPNGWVEKLPQASRMEIAYLLSPQAALLNEHLLAHTDKLRRSTATSAGGNRQQWEQRLWSASLDHLLTEAESDIVPAAYLQALARGVSNEADPWTTLRAWYEALNQSKAFGTVHTVLQNFFSGTSEKNQTSMVLHLSTQPEAVTQTGKLEDAGLPETSPEKAVTPGQKKQVKQAETAYEELYGRIAEALQKAGLIDTGFASMLMELVPVERRQRLRCLLQSPAVKNRLAQLPQAVFLDISYLLLPQAALLMERLLAHADRLYQLSRADGYTTRKHWKQQRWSVALDYLLREADSPGAIDPIDFMRALAQGAHGKSAKTQITLHAWHEALAHSESHSVIVTLLRMLIDETPERNEQAEESVTQSGKLSQENTLQQPLHNHLTTGNATPGQQDLKILLEALVAGYPEQLRRLYQDLRSDRYDWAALQLSATSLHSLIEKLLQIRSGIAGTDWRVFLQAIEAQADRVDDQVTYYRLILEDLLQEREIDLEVIAVQACQPFGRTQDDEEDRDKQAGVEETRRMGEAEGTEIVGQVIPEAAAELVVYPAGQSTTKPIHIGHAALYLRITAVLQKAGLISEHSAITAMGVKPDELSQRLRAILRGINTNGWVEKLPQASRMDIAYLLSPQAALLNEHLLAQANKLQRSIAMNAGRNRKQWEQRLWEVSLNYLLTEIESEITPAVYLQALARDVSNDADPRSTLHAWYEALQQSKASAVIRTLLQIIAEASALLLRMNKENKENPDSTRLMAGAKENTTTMQKPPLLDWDALLHRAQSMDDVREEIYIENAGQVLAAPYLPRLFSMLKLVEDGAFIDRHAAERAVHLLQFMVNEQTQSPEYQLTLNKILCGVTTGIPICAEIDISAHEQETIEGLVRGMIQNWQTIGNTSISGLRETFLQRKGKLQLKEDGMWYLTVEPGVFDMLLDSLPWSFSVIKHGWMERAVNVTWR